MAGDLVDTGVAPLWPGEFSRDKLFALVRKLYRRFYLHPKVILRELKTLCSWRALKRRARYMRTLLSR